MSEIFEDFRVWFYKAPAKRIMAAILIIAFGMFIGSFALFYLLDVL